MVLFGTIRPASWLRASVSTYKGSPRLRPQGNRSVTKIAQFRVSRLTRVPHQTGEHRPSGTGFEPSDERAQPAPGPISDVPGRLGPRPEGTVDHALLGLVEHEIITDHTYAALNIVQSVTGVGAPSRRTEQIAGSSPLV